MQMTHEIEADFTAATAQQLFESVTGYHFETTVPGQLLARRGVRKIRVNKQRQALYSSRHWPALWCDMLALAHKRCGFDGTEPPMPCPPPDLPVEVRYVAPDAAKMSKMIINPALKSLNNIRAGEIERQDVITLDTVCILIEKLTVRGITSIADKADRLIKPLVQAFDKDTDAVVDQSSLDALESALIQSQREIAKINAVFVKETVRAILDKFNSAV